MVDWFVGTMGFGYKPWQGSFYPDKLPRAQQLPFYAGRFNALEMDSTFYGVPRLDFVGRWQEVTPEGFRFCPKAPREITHDLRLSATESILQHFLDTMRVLGDRLGPIVLQFPPDFKTDQRHNLEGFMHDLPKDIRFAVEFRHRSWWDETTADMLRAYGVCWIAADYVHMPKEIWRTTDFLYLRFLGRHGQFATKTHEVLDRTADLRRWHESIIPHLDNVTAVYAFFNNDYAGFSPATANRFKAIIELETEPTGTPQQGRLF
jgi:uncharacterized protein YecE (DUF72 family)